MSEREELTVRLPIRLIDTLRWYASFCSFGSGPMAPEDLDALVEAGLKSFLEQEANDPQMAWDYAKAELNTQLGV